MNPIRSLRCAVLVAGLAGWACGRGDSPGDGSGANQDPPDGPMTSAAASEVPTNAWPADPCAWIPTAAVESIMGPLAGPARRDQNGCLFPLPEDASPEAVRRREAGRKLRDAAEALARRTGEALTVPEAPPSEPAVILQVSLETAPGEQGIKAAEEVLAQWAEAPLGIEGRKDGGWDYAKSPITLGLPGFLGRVGQLAIMVHSQDLSVPAPKMAALAASVRDRIPDRPFQAPDGQRSSGSPAGPDPCSLLTPSEAEEVLGPLAVSPYRILESSPYPDPGGGSCGYRTAGHRVLALTPHWTYGRSVLEANRAVGGLASRILPGDAPETADTIEGPWDEAARETATGDIAFLTGDRALEVSFGTSSTDAGGAVRLARIAVERLAKASAR